MTGGLVWIDWWLFFPDFMVERMHKDGQRIMSVRSVAGSLRLDLDRYDQGRYDHIHEIFYKREAVFHLLG